MKNYAKWKRTKVLQETKESFKKIELSDKHNLNNLDKI